MSRTLSGAEAGLGCLLIILFMAITIPLNAWTICCFWNWYIVPLTHFAPIGIVAAFGVGLFFAVLSHNYQKPDKETPALQSICQSFAAVLIKYGFVWIVAGFIHLLAR